VFADVDEVVKSVKRPSELERKMRPFSDTGHWKAEDYRQFILSMVGLVCSQQRFMKDLKIYHLLVYLSNLVYLMYDPYVTDASIAEMEQNMGLFVDLYHARIGSQGCTWKFHIFQHFIQLIKRHGSALFWDGFFRECVVGELKKFLTGTRNEDQQIVSNFLLSRHARRYFDACLSNDRMKAFFDGERPKFRGISLTEIVKFDCEKATEVTDQERENVFGLYESEEDEEVFRVKRCKKGGTVLTSRRFAHRGQVDDTWIYLNERTFGQIEDMFVLNSAENKSVVVKLRKYEKVPLMDERTLDGDEMLFPINQFPAECTGEFEYHLVDHSVRVQKMTTGMLKHQVEEDVTNHTFFCVWPERV
jgi:hypothetical protein